jgi:glycosyltransferase involved in cell wall biosynthesis
MKIGLVWLLDTPLISISVRYERYYEGFHRLGHDVVTVCVPNAAEGYPHPVLTAPDEKSFRSEQFWRSTGLDCVVVVNWLVYPDEMEAMRNAGLTVIAFSDSDCLIGVRAHPKATLQRYFHQHRKHSDRWRAGFLWLRLWVHGKPYWEQQTIRACAAAHRTLCYSEESRRAMGHFLRSYGRPDLEDRIAVAPYPAADAYTRCDPSASKREARLIAVGRWDDPQKDAKLVIEAWRRYRQSGGSATLVVAGSRGECFAGMSKEEGFEFAGMVTPSELAALFLSSRALLVASRWESGPIILSEALSAGASCVGVPEVPSIVTYSGLGLGTCAVDRSPAGVAEAIAHEMDCWERGERDPERIAALGRARFSVEAVAAAVLLEIENVRKATAN